MADSKQQAAAGGAPVPDAAPAPTSASPDVTSRAAELEAELDRIRSASAGATVMVRVLPPHAEFTHAGRTVRREPGPVPAVAAAAMAEAAQHAGVSLEQMEG